MNKHKDIRKAALNFRLSLGDDLTFKKVADYITEKGWRLVFVGTEGNEKIIKQLAESNSDFCPEEFKRSFSCIIGNTEYILIDTNLPSSDKLFAIVRQIVCLVTRNRAYHT